MSKRDAPATHRNREPIRRVLARWLTGPARVLEIASGSGQHAVHLASALPALDWQPTEVEPENLASIAAWTAEVGAANVRAPVRLDATALPWPIAERSFDAVFNANMIHIAPWAVAEGLFAGAAHVLRSGGLLFLYGPFKRDGAHTAPSNEAFDADLRRRDPSWGVRDLERVVATAEREGLVLVETNEMPANNLLLVFRRVRSL